MFYRDAIRGADALIGEIDGSGEKQKKTGWMKQAWHRRLTWLRWLRELRGYLEDKETMALARIVKIEALEREIARRDHVFSQLSRPIMCHTERQGCEMPHVCVLQRICTYAPPVKSGSVSEVAGEASGSANRSARAEDQSLNVPLPAPPEAK